MADMDSVERMQEFFSNFLTSEGLDSKYINRITDAIQERKFRVVIDINDIRKQGRADVANDILRRPREYVLALQKAAEQTAKDQDPQLEKLLKTATLQVGFEGSLGRNSVSPRGLVSGLLNNLVEVEGIVTKVSSVKPKIVRSVHFCPATNKYTTKEYRDNTSLEVGVDMGGRVLLVTPTVFPLADEEQNPLELEHGLCSYKDYQTIVLQEMPERAQVGQLPRSVELIVECDLVDRAKPGDRIRCTGIYMPLAGGGATEAVFKSVLLCNNMSIIGKEVGSVKLSGNDVRNIRTVSNTSENVLDVLARSLCPTILGHKFIKRALILQLVGGTERNLANGTHLRGDINIMMVGDPSTAKSQLLRSVMQCAPLALSTTGRGSSGVGLTAAVTIDVDTGEKRLEAGAMVLADRGVVCIDEFDKMSENDRVAIHEVMEQQTVTIAKAGIHASLNARCSVVAAANPVYGQYDKSRRPQENIGLPDSLLSRFDLLFIVLDQMDPTIDRELSEHVIKSHQYRRPGTIMEPEPLNQASSLNLDEDEIELLETPVWQRGGRTSGGGDGGSGGDLLSKAFLRKFIHYAKNRVMPELSEEAMDSISNAYSTMRSQQTKKNLPVTARSLETLIRLSTAHAKIRLSKSVDNVDVDCAMELVNFVLFHDIGSDSENAPPSVNMGGGGGGGGGGSGDGDGGGNMARRQREAETATEETYPPTAGSTPSSPDSKKRRADKGAAASPDASNSLVSLSAAQRIDLYERARGVAVSRDDASYRELMRVVQRMFVSDSDTLELLSVWERFRHSPQGGSTLLHFVAMIFELQNENKIMFDDNEDTITVV